MQRLSSPLDRPQGSTTTRWWWAPATAAAWRPCGWRGRAGASPVLERGREFATGEFPAVLPDLRGEMSVDRRALCGSDRRPACTTALRRGHACADGMRAGRRIAHQCRRGARPDDRVFADAAWPDEVARGRAAGGRLHARAARLRPARYPRRPSSPSIARCSGERGARHMRRCAAPVWWASRRPSIPRASASPPARGAATAARGCNVGAKNTVALTYLPEAARTARRSSPS